MEPWARAMVAADEAEARGDAVTALEVMETFATGPDGRVFWRPWRVTTVLQLAIVGPTIPSWVVSRWVCNQAMQALEPGNRDPIRRALGQAIALRGGRDRLPGVDRADAESRVVDRDWVFRQLFLYELGGLDRFLRRGASSTLLARAGSVHTWARTPMGGFRLVGSDPGSVTWLDLGSQAEVATANIGSAALVEPGETVIGRLVEIEDGRMFETCPLRVPEEVAQRVAGDPAHWFAALEVAATTGEEPIQTSTGPVSLVSDVPEVVWQMAVLADVPPPDDAFASALVDRILGVAAEELSTVRSPAAVGEVDIWPCIAAALLSPCVAAALPHLVLPDELEVLARLAELLAEPAASLCGRVVALRDVA